MASTFFGNTLTDLQSGITAGERNAGDTERARIAADSAKMAAYFSLLSNKAKTEAEAHAHEAENARSYFALNLADAQKKAELAQSADLAANQWANQVDLQKTTLDSQKQIADAANETTLAHARIQYPEGMLSPALAVERSRELAASNEAASKTEDLNKTATAIASRANLALDGVRSQHGKTMSAANASIAGGNMSSDWIGIGPNSTWFPSSAQETKPYLNLKQKADDQYQQDVLAILKQHDPTGELITFDPKLNRFVPVVRTPARFGIPTRLAAPGPMLQTNSVPSSVTRTNSIPSRVSPPGYVRKTFDESTQMFR